MIDFKNRNIILSLLVIVLLALGVYVNDPFGMFTYSLKSADPLLSNLDESKIQKIIVKDAGKVSKTFTRTESGFNVQEAQGPTYSADSKKMQTGIDNLNKIKRYRVITSNKDKQAEYQVTDNDFVLEISTQGSEVQKLYLGRQGTAFNTTVVRLGDDDDIYSAPGALRNDWNQDINTYRNKKLFKFDKANISSIEIDGPFSYKLQKNSLGKFTLVAKSGEKPALKTRIDNIFSQLASLQGTKFADKASGKKYGSVKINLQNNLTAQLEIRGPNKSSEFLIVSDQTQTPMLTPKYKIDSILVDPAQLEDKSSTQQTPAINPLKGP